MRFKMSSSVIQNKESLFVCVFVDLCNLFWHNLLISSTWLYDSGLLGSVPVVCKGSIIYYTLQGTQEGTLTSFVKEEILHCYSDFMSVFNSIFENRTLFVLYCLVEWPNFLVMPRPPTPPHVHPFLILSRVGSCTWATQRYIMCYYTGYMMSTFPILIQISQ